MIESLLYPKKLTKAPNLLVNAGALFTGKSGNMSIPLIGSASSSSTITFRLIDAVAEDDDTAFRIGFIKKLSRSSAVASIRITLPFQSIMVYIDEFRCHGWNTTDADLLSTPSKTEIKQTIQNRPSVGVRRYFSDDFDTLFRMLGEELENYGLGPQFSSVGEDGSLYSGIDCTMRNSSADIQDDFPDMFDNYATKMLALEVIVRVKVYGGADSDGFRTGLAQL